MQSLERAINHLEVLETEVRKNVGNTFGWAGKILEIVAELKQAQHHRDEEIDRMGQMIHRLHDQSDRDRR